MNYETTLATVRELSERAVLRPAPQRLRCGPWPPPSILRAPATRLELDAAWQATKLLAHTEQERQRKMTRKEFRQ